MADIHAPQARNPVEVLAALGIKHMGALATGYDETAFLLECREMSVRVNRIVAILPPKGLGVVVFL